MGGRRSKLDGSMERCNQTHFRKTKFGFGTLKENWVSNLRRNLAFFVRSRSTAVAAVKERAHTACRTHTESRPIPRDDDDSSRGFKPGQPGH